MMSKASDKEVTLLYAHTHKGVAHSAGSKIKVTEQERQWLEANGVIKQSTKKEVIHHG